MSAAYLHSLVISLSSTLYSRSLSQSYCNKYECNKYQDLADAAVYAMGTRCGRIHKAAALFCMKWRHGHHLESMPPY